MPLSVFLVMRRGRTDDEVREAVSASISIRQALKRLGLKPAGGNYAVMNQRMKALGLDTSHFTGPGWRRGSTMPIVPAKCLQDLLQRGVHVQSYKLKHRLLQAKLKEARCERCGLEVWQDQPIPLELDHVNGDRTDNRLENLRMLCPNCHALTDTYRGKNMAKRRDETAPS